MTRQTILLLFGGQSSEHEVSIMSAHNVFAALDNEKYSVKLAYIDRVGRWWLVPSIDSGHIGCPQLLPVLGHGQFVTLPSNNIIRPDIILPVLHGQGGEDGSVQSLAQLLHIPIVGCDVGSSVLCWDKLLTKSILNAHNIQSAPHMVARLHKTAPGYQSVLDTLGAPFFVKPTKGGSSVGVSKVVSENEYKAALTLAHKESDTVLIEKAIEGRELEVAILGNPPNHKASGVGEIKVSVSFYSYEEKYSKTSSASVTATADISKELSKTLRDKALKAYSALGCKGLARVDFLVDSRQNIYLNEVNTFPGFTNISQYPKLWQQQGVSYSELLDKLIQLAA